MKSITILQAYAIMDSIAKNMCGIYGTISIDEMTEKVNQLTRNAFNDICDILEITEIES